MVSFKTFLISLPLVANVLAHTIPGIDSIQKQLVARDDVNGIFDDLPAKDIDFINLHLKELTSLMAVHVVNVRTKSSMDRVC